MLVSYVPIAINQLNVKHTSVHNFTANVKAMGVGILSKWTSRLL